LSEELVPLFAKKDFATAPFFGVKHRGRVFVANPAPLDKEVLPLVEAVAFRVAAELDDLKRLKDVSIAAAARERLRLARDLHDSILQDLTAARLQFQMLSPGLSAEARSRVDEISELISTQQRRLRQLAAPTAPTAGAAGSSSRFSNQEQLTELVDRLSRQWRCRIGLHVDQVYSKVPAELANEICLILSEAVANSVRHGGATDISIEVRSSSSDKLGLVVADNGTGFDKDGAIRSPASLMGRVRERGGICELTASNEGAKLEIELPWA
jgi:signal transduction histidine kinase